MLIWNFKPEHKPEASLYGCARTMLGDLRYLKNEILVKVFSTLRGATIEIYSGTAHQ